MTTAKRGKGPKARSEANKALFQFYRIKGYRKAHEMLTSLTDQFALSKLKEIQTLRKTLMKWREPCKAHPEAGLRI
ncbi:MAG: hypothetical protein EB078_05090 [Proteobacteria bacterium]|nr:hypothetical protein [Pseudomonadota bacterium]NDC25249.1 hypothetical protein [Pseudomonadota bacterium]NDD04260.1 hypothetical protein [Pseudomonadota bacterium]NDG26782.1 hypothetical protein [Pseudomonadota bacterium]